MSSLSGKNCWCLGIILFIFGISIVSALQINEVYPKTSEYVEIHNSDGWINLSEWQIKDESTGNPDSITCYNIINCSLTINDEYFLIIGRNTNISEITLHDIKYFYVDDSTIGNSLNDDGDNITFFNASFYSSLIYNYSQINKSWQFYNNSWQLCIPTPGAENFCQTNANNNTGLNNTNANNTNTTVKPEITLELRFDNETTNGDEMNVEVKARNLENKSYDIKIFLTFKENETVISEIYDSNDSNWQNGNYYLKDVFAGGGNKTKTLKIRINEKYRDFSGTARIMGKIREADGSDAITSFEANVEITQFTESAKQNTQAQEEETNNAVLITNNSLIQLNKPKDIKSQESKEYKSKTEYIKEYSIYGFALFCVLIILFLMLKKKW